MKKITSFLLILSVIFLSSCANKPSDDVITTTEKNSAITTESNLINESDLTTVTTNGQPTTRATVFYTHEIETNPSDPYSFVIKKRCEEFKHQWENTDIYNDFSAEGFELYLKYFKDIYYFLYDLDKDGTNELLLGGWQKIGYYTEEPDPPKKICISSAYAIQDGKAVKLNSGTWWDFEFVWDRVLLSNGIIMTTWGIKEDPSYSFFSYENNSLIFKGALYHTENGEYCKRKSMKYFDEQTISTAEHDRIYNEMCGNSSVVDINWKRIDEYGM